MKPQLLLGGVVLLMLLLVVGLAVVSPRLKAESQSLGTASLQVPDLIHALYADFDPKDFARLHMEPGPDGTGRVVAAYDEWRRGKTFEAQQNLKAAWSDAKEETRVRLLAAHAFRQIGGTVPEAEAKVVHGIVVEVPVDAGTDLLGAYEDGTIRYLNAAAGGVFVEPDTKPALNAQAKELVRLANDVRMPDPISKGEATLTLLTFGGNHRVGTSTKESATVLTQGTALFLDLVKFTAGSGRARRASRHPKD